MVSYRSLLLEFFPPHADAVFVPISGEPVTPNKFQSIHPDILWHKTTYLRACVVTGRTTEEDTHRQVKDQLEA